MPAGVRGFISFHVLRKQNISLYASMDTDAALAKKRTEIAFAFSVLFLSVGIVFYLIYKTVLKSTHPVEQSFCLCKIGFQRLIIPELTGCDNEAEYKTDYRARDSRVNSYHSVLK